MTDTDSPIPVKSNHSTVSLILGSGGARGLAHIGVIRWLNEHGFHIGSISGCSMGALVGGIYAAGKLDEFEHWVRAITKVDMITLLDLSWGGSGLVKGDKIINTLIDLVGDQMIEDLPLSYTAVATDIDNRKEIWLQSGRLFDAIRASIAIPLFFTPFPYRGVQLIDGGVLNPVPIAPTFGDHTDLSIAVNLGGRAVSDEAEPEPAPEPGDVTAGLQTKVGRFIKKLQRSTQAAVSFDWDAYDIASQAFDAMQTTIARQKLAAYPPDHAVEIARNACGTMDFDRAGEMIELGYQRAEECLRGLKYR